jgi:hypothetical protein
MVAFAKLMHRLADYSFRKTLTARIREAAKGGNKKRASRGGTRWLVLFVPFRVDAAIVAEC